MSLGKSQKEQYFRPFTTSKLANDVISRMIEFLPEDRISIKEVLAMPFFEEETLFEDFDDFGFA